VANRAFWQKHSHEEEGKATLPPFCHPREVVVVVDDEPPLSALSSSSSSSSSRLPHHDDDDDPPQRIPRSITCVTPPSTSIAGTSSHPASHPPPISGAMSPLLTTPPSLHGLSESDPGTGCNSTSPQEGDRDTVTGGEPKEEPNKRSDDRPSCFHPSQPSKRSCHCPVPSRRDDDNHNDHISGGGIRAVSRTSTTTTTDHHPPKDSLQRRMKLWTNLLRQRPMSPHNNEEAMSRWLMNVLAVSDVTTPLYAKDGYPHVDDNDEDC